MKTSLHAHMHVCDHVLFCFLFLFFFCIGRFWLQNTEALSRKSGQQMAPTQPAPPKLGSS